MLETTSMVVCGAIKVDEIVQPIYCNPETGDCAFELPSTDFPQLIANVSVENPLELKSMSEIAKTLDSANVMGMILCEDNKVISIFDEDTAGERTYAEAGNRDLETFSIDLDCDYEIEEDEEY